MGKQEEINFGVELWKDFQSAWKKELIKTTLKTEVRRIERERSILFDEIEIIEKECEKRKTS